MTDQTDKNPRPDETAETADTEETGKATPSPDPKEHAEENAHGDKTDTTTPDPESSAPDETDTRSFGEKVEDTMDEVMGNVQDFLYGPGDDPAHDIPATIETSSGIRKINKTQTRRNFNRLLMGKSGAKWFLIIVAIMFAIGLLVHFIG